ncbi:MAG: hypothetical protein AAF399_04165 [Bacteroidota bacterium]
MTRTFFSTLLSLSLLALIGLSGCIQDTCTEERRYYAYEPVYLSFDDLRASVQSEASRDLKQPGKLYFKDQFIYITEVNEGVHVYNNQNPSDPQAVGFIQVPGIRDLAIKGNVLYVDSYTDLVAIDITDPLAVEEVNRELDVFPYGSTHPGLWADPSQGVAIDWVETQIEQEIDCSTGWGGGGWNLRNSFLENDVALGSVSSFASNSDFAASPTPQGPSSGPGQGGSMARFTLVGDFLYCVTDFNLLPFGVSDESNPTRQTQVNIGWGIETIFPMKDHLFIGSQTGMFIYDLDNPRSPGYVSEFQHVRACDPVVVEGDWAYVTLRNGEDNTCNGFTNQLDVVNIENLAEPFLFQSFSMFNPHGLGIRDDVLFICDGEDGLKVYDATEKSEIDNNLLAHFPDINAVDVIPLENILLMIGADGFYQYDYSDLQNIREISQIPIVRE